MSSPSILVWNQYVASTRTHTRELPFAFCYFLSLGFLWKHQIILKAFLFRLTLWTPLAFWFLFQHLIVSRFRRQMEFSYRARILQPSVIWFGSRKTCKSTAAGVSSLMVAGVWPQLASLWTITCHFAGMIMHSSLVWFSFFVVNYCLVADEQKVVIQSGLDELLLKEQHLSWDEYSHTCGQHTAHTHK